LQPELVPGEGYTEHSFADYNKYASDDGMSGDEFYRDRLNDTGVEVLFSGWHQQDDRWKSSYKLEPCNHLCSIGFVNSGRR